jgi:hypothetical protein
MLLALLLVLSAPAFGQRVVAARAGTLYYTEGAVTLDGARVPTILPNQYPQLRENQILETGQGRAELLLGPEAMLWLDHASSLRIVDTRLEDAVLELASGSAIVEVHGVRGNHRLRVIVNGAAAEMRETGVYRFDAAPARVRVFDGQAAVEGSAALRRGQEAAPPSAPAAKFDRKQRDDFHFWAAFRSLRLLADSGGAGRWEPAGRGVVAHSGFGVQFSRNASAARLQYLTAVRAGVVNYVEGVVAVESAEAQPARARAPLAMEPGTAVGTGRGRAEILLGPGVALRIVENARVRLLEAALESPEVAVERGAAMIEVSNAGRNARARVRVGGAVTEIVKEGLYEFDSAGLLRVYGGETLTRRDGAPVKARSGQTLDLTAPAGPGKFEEEARNSLFRWSAARSFALFRAAGALMTNWDARGFAAVARHPQFGSQPYAAARRR